ncbi:MAG: hypothetical protein UU88_C0015G0046 [Parcubacteria group bacterium GW2011_GWC1_42_11]|nr:MAG: hypothetical protein UU88_C0015G0046 [Parcubacteria group bacterium GW2011_GWC1_42_11]
MSSPVVREYVTVREFERSRGAYYLSEAGSEDAMYRIMNLDAIDAQEIISLDGNKATTTITTISAIKKTINSIGDILFNTRRVKSTLTVVSGASFNYGVQAGDGGVYMKSTSSITGNLYSAGPVCGGTASMYANKIYSSIIASTTVTCNTISGSNRGSCTYPWGTQEPVALPIQRPQIESWEAAATAGGVITQAECSSHLEGDGTYEYEYIINSSRSLGPVEIQCDLEITGATSGSGPTITLTGPVWVRGKIDISKYLTVRVDPSLSGQGLSMVMIADNPADRIDSSEIEVENYNPIFEGAGANSWVMLLSENSAASQGVNEDAIRVADGVTGAIILYARLGTIYLRNTTSVREVTGYKISLDGSSSVIYESGLQNVLFNSGPGGAWTIQDWKEGQ